MRWSEAGSCHFKNICTFHAQGLFDSIYFSYKSLKFHFILVLELVVTQLEGPSHCPMRKINCKDNLSTLFSMGRYVFLKHSWSLSMPLFTSFQRMLTHLICKFEKKEQDTTAELPSFIFLGANCLQ